MAEENLPAGPYQMFGEVVDVVLFSDEFLYLEELPVAYAQQHWRDQPRSLDPNYMAWWM